MLSHTWTLLLLVLTTISAGPVRTVEAQSPDRESAPAVAAVPDTVPRGWSIPSDSANAFFRHENLVIVHPRASGPYPRNLVLVLFGASREERQSAVDLVEGSVVGGNGVYYYLLLPDCSSEDPVWRAHDLLVEFPRVLHVSPLFFAFTSGAPPEAAERPSALPTEDGAAILSADPPRGWTVSEDAVRAFYADENTVLSHPRMSGPYPANLVMVAFREGSSTAEVRRGIDEVGGVVVGGNGVHYFLHVEIGGPACADLPVWCAIDLLERLPQVELANPLMTGWTTESGPAVTLLDISVR